MASIIQNTINNVLGDGARSTKFECLINFNNISLFPNKEDLIFLTKSSQIPGKTHEVIDFKYKGRTIPLKGQVKYDNTWSCTFYMTQDHKLKHAFENWIESLDQQHNFEEPGYSVQESQMKNYESYTTTIQIIQMDFDGSQKTAAYELYNVFPKSVSGVDVSYESAGEILEFTVEFSYSHFKSSVLKNKDGSFSDEIKEKVLKEVKGIAGNISNQVSSAVKDFVNSAKNVLDGGVESVNTKTAKSKTGSQIDFDPSNMFSKLI